MNDIHSAPSAPQVRTLLLTDLVDSTSLVERLGDGPAAELFREHDRLVLELQQRWRGRLIDRSDGLLLLFERPLDGLGFALDYARGLRTLGESRQLPMLARAGLHVGEVLTWKNSATAVQAGAKPLEVEGLAKPLAGRLMTLARPGQILLSATAEPLARRAARELGERSEHLIWKSHGRWRFKGVPDPQEVFEVGEPGFAPLRAPKQNHAKAWRDIPLWRRPTALAAELLLVAGMATGLWFITRPQPAIAFGERDWVVVADLRNLTGQAVLDESLEQAFRISLEQSRYVNVLSDLKVRDTLERMKRRPETTLDRAIASEIAIRDGARAVILPTVAEVGGRLRVSAEVIDPHTQTTVYAESADGAGAASALDSIDDVTAALRGRLGEAIDAIERDSMPLPQVSTDNLDALKAYALGERRFAEGDGKAAIAYFRRALELDHEFALALAAIGRVQTSEGDTVAAMRNLRSAAGMRQHLTSREALAVDAAVARVGPVPNLLQRWRQLVEMYPDALQARFGLAHDQWMLANRYAEGLPHARAAQVQQFVMKGRAHYLEGILQLGMERYQEAGRAFESARAQGFAGDGVLHAALYLAQRDYAGADAAFARRQPGAARGFDAAGYSYRFARQLDRGDFAGARATVAEARAGADAANALFDASNWRFWGLAVDLLEGRESQSAIGPRIAALHAWVRERAAELDGAYGPASYEATLALGYLAALANDRNQLALLLAEVDDRPAGVYPLADQVREVLRAESDRQAGRAAQAVARLAPLAARADGVFVVHSALLRAHRDQGDAKAALVQAGWLATHRGRAFVERTASDLLLPVMIADTTRAQLDAAELQARLGDAAGARRALQRFTRQWPRAQLDPALRHRLDRLAAPADAAGTPAGSSGQRVASALGARLE